MWRIIDKAFGLTSWRWLRGGRNRVKGRRSARPPQGVRLKVESLENRVVPSGLALGTDGNLWQEAPGWQTDGRVLIDGNVRGFAQGNDNYIYVLGNDGNLWKEYPHWQLTNGRTWVDGNVRSFARGSDGYDYVLGSDGNLWKELPGWQTLGRTWVDRNVQSFARGSDSYDYVLGSDGNLWKELPGWVTQGRTWVDGNVLSFARGNDGYDYVLGRDGNLWKELPGWQQLGRTWVDGRVRAFARGNDGYDYVLGTDLNLWKELPGWQIQGRTWVDGNVKSFSLGDDGYDYVLGTDGNLWQELPGWQIQGRTWVDGDARASAFNSDVYCLVLGPRPAADVAYSPASGTLFGPNRPSYLDVQQGFVADCWLIASLAEVAARAPLDITGMFTYDGTTVDNGSAVDIYTVRLYDGNGVAQYFTVDTELPASGTYYDRPVGGPGAVNGSPSPVLWVALAEKAYVEANAYSLVTTNNVGLNSYAAINYGWPEWALRAITGNSTTAHYAINPSDVASAWNAGELVVLCTDSQVDSHIVSSHCYALVNYDASSGLPFELMNPWGTDANRYAPSDPRKYGLSIANAPFLSQNFSSQSYGWGS
jgi:hypothetical protein